MQDRSRIRKGMVAAVTGVDSAADMETEEVPAVDAGVTGVDTVDTIKIKGISEVGVVVATEEVEGAATTAAEAAMEEDTAEAVEEETRTKHRSDAAEVDGVQDQRKKNSMYWALIVVRQMHVMRMLYE